MKKEQHRIKTKVILLLIAVVVLFILVACAAVITKKVSATRQDADLESYYNLTASESAEREAAAENELAIVMEGEILQARAVYIDGFYYIGQEVAEEYIDERLYYGEEDGILLLTNAVQTYKTFCDSTVYSLDDEETDLGHSLVMIRDGTVYISLEYLMIFSNMEYAVYEDPARVVITYETGEVQYCDTTSDTRIRTGAYKQAYVVVKAESGTKLKILEASGYEDWIKVVSEDGWVGYAAAEDLTEAYTETISAEYSDPDYTSLSAGEQVVLGFAAIYNSSANSTYSELTENAGDTMDVYCPLWYSLSDDEDYFESISSSYYTELAHADGYLVWAVFSDTNITTGENFGDDVLSSYEKRQIIIDAVMADMEANGIDGLNLDFECIESSYSEDYLQFLRELSVRCRAAGKYLTADNYAPYTYNDTIFSISEQNDLCDYVVIMAYDDYVGTDEAGPNSSSPFLEEVLELSLDKIDAEKLIIALPLYSRFWYEQDGSLTNDAYSYSSSWSAVEAAGAEAVWDSELGVYYAEYTSENGTVWAWLESAESYTEKLDILSEYDLAGVGFWRLGWETEEIWQITESYY